MIGTSPTDYVIIRTSVFLIRAITPLSILYVAVLPFSKLPLSVSAYPIAETLFYFFVHLPRTYILQHEAKHPLLLPRNERRELFQQCQANVEDPERYLQKWFLDAPAEEIKRENVKEFFRWALLNKGTMDPADEEELEEYASGVEKDFGIKLEPGRGKAKCLRLTLDDVVMKHRPLAWYMTVFTVDLVTHARLLYSGFHYHRTPLTFYPTVFPPRPQTLLTTHRSPSRKLSYWHRPHTSTTKLPIVFLHGIGIGLMPYVRFLTTLNNNEYKLEDNDGSGDDDGSIGIIAIEILPISFRITAAALEREDMCRQIQTILIRHGFDEFVLVSHSYGSVISTHLLKTPSIAPQIRAVVLIDPVSILLHLPDVAYNFTYRKPTKANEHQLHYFASTDPSVAHTLSRCFFWSENILFPRGRSIPPTTKHVTVFLAGRDLIVNVDAVARYLTGSDDDSWKGGPVGMWEGEGGRLRVVWCKPLDHAQVFEGRKWVELLVREVRRVAGSSRREREALGYESAGQVLD